MSTIEQVHEVKVHYGDWHIFAVCRTCFWEGDRSGMYNAGRTDHDGNARSHQRRAHRRWVKANRWWRRLLERHESVIHHVAGSSGQSLVCCGRHPLKAHGLDRFTFDADEATCNSPTTPSHQPIEETKA